MRIPLAAWLALSGSLLARAGAAQPPSSAPDPRSPAEPGAEAPPGDAPPDLDFLEYLGSWQTKDDEWLAIKEWDEGERRQGQAGRPRAPERARDDDDEDP